MTISTDTASPAGHATSAPAALKTSPRPATPDEARLEMPTQSLGRQEKPTRKPRVAGGTWLARLTIFGGALALTCYGAWEMYKVVSVGGHDDPRMGAAGALRRQFLVDRAGLYELAGRLRVDAVPGAEATRHPGGAVDAHGDRHADLQREPRARLRRTRGDVRGGGSHRPRPRLRVVLPLRHDEPRRLRRRGEGLPEDARAVWPQAQIWYRHRPQNTARKAGNIADFVTRWGARYDHMLVLDADSFMLGHAMVNLAAAMEADAGSGARDRPSSNSLRLLGLPDALKALLRGGSISVGHARALLGLEPGDQQHVAERIVRDGMTVRDVERFGDRRRKPGDVSKPRERRAPSPDRLALENRLRYAVGAQVSIVGGRGAGRIEIRFADEAELSRIVEALLPEGS